MFLLPCPWITFCLLLCFGSLFDTTIKTALGSILFSWSHSVTGNMLSLYTSFSEKQSYSQLIYFEMCIRCQNVCFCFGFFFNPIYVMVFRPPRLPLERNSSFYSHGSCKKLYQISQILSDLQRPLHPSIKLYNKRHIKSTINKFNSLQCKTCCLPLSVEIIPLA